MLNESNIPLEEDGIEEEILVDEEVAITKAMWGDIGGNIENQTDLQNALDAKQDSLTEAQLNAVNSGITAEKVTTYDGYADQIASKADQSALNAETIARGEADTALGTRIDNEALARQQTDNGLQSQIDAITSKSDVVDVVANYAALQAYDTSTLGNNDVVKVLDDETHEDALTYYRWSTTTQTWSYIGQEAPYYSKGQMDVMLQGKQDKLTAGANIQIQNGTISATDTTYTAGNGLNLNGTEFSADTDVLATKEDLEDYYTKTEADNLLAPKLEAEVVTELPTTGAEGKLYLTPKAHTTSTATGNPITATVTEQAGQLESFQLNGDTYQQTYSGKNLINPSAISNTNNGITYSFDPTTNEITLDGTATAKSTCYFSNENKISLDGEYTLSYEKVSGSITPSGTCRIEIAASSWGSNTIYLNLQDSSASITATKTFDVFAVDFNISQGTICNNFKIKLQLEKSASATSFEPYVGRTASPNPEYPQPIQTVTGEQTITVAGKNKINMPYREFEWNGASVLQNGTTLTMKPNSDSNMGMSYSTPAIPVAISTGETITWSRTWLGGGTWNSGSFTFPLEITYSDGTTETISLGDTTKNNYLVAASRSVTLAKDVVSVRLPNALCYGIKGMTGDIVFGVQLEHGSTATAYAPYSHQTLPLDLGTIELCKLGTYQDYIWKDGEGWKIHKATRKYTFTGDEQWSSGGVGNHCCYATSITDYATSNNVPYSPYFGGVSNVNGAGTMGGKPDNSIAFIDQSATVRFYIRTSKFENDAPALKTWLSTHNTDVYYALATATDTIITDTDLIAQLEAIRTASLGNGANTITNTATGTNLAGDMELGYYEYDPTNRYDKWLWLDINNNYEQIGS